MKKWLECANQYVEESDWKDISLLKLCLCAIGIMIGLSIPKEKKEAPFAVAGFVFIVTYIPLMAKFLNIAVKTFRAEKDREV